MTTIQIQLPDKLAQDAQAAGLLTPEAMESMLREQLKKQAGEDLRAMWVREPQEAFTPEIEQTILSVSDQVAAAGIAPMSLDAIQEEVNAARKARRAAGR